MRDGLLPFGKAFEAPAVHQKNIQPIVVVVVVEGDAAACCFQQIFVFVFAAENCFCVEAGFARDIDETNPDFLWRSWIWIRVFLSCRGLIRLEWTRQSENAFEREDERGAA